MDQTSNIRHENLPGAELPEGRYDYLPAQTLLPVHRILDTARIRWSEQPLDIALVAVEPAEIVDTPLGWRGISTTLQITNRGDRDLSLSLREILDAMSSSRRVSTSDNGMIMASPVQALVPEGATSRVAVLWFVEASEPDSLLWITANLPLTEEGYARLDAGGAIFILAVSDVDYPRGTPTPCALSATFVRESIPDNATLSPGQAFAQTWVIQNSGTCRWPEGSTWTHVGGEQLGARTSIELETIPQPQGFLTVTVSMTAPVALGTHRSDWRLQAPTGEPYGRTFYVEFVVTDTLNTDPAPGAGG